eukprot:365157-Chlamydomonas_euryale.AAC.8
MAGCWPSRDAVQCGYTWPSSPTFAGRHSATPVACLKQVCRRWQPLPRLFLSSWREAHIVSYKGKGTGTGFAEQEGYTMITFPSRYRTTQHYFQETYLLKEITQGRWRIGLYC